MIDLTFKDISFIENACLKSGNLELLGKFIEIKDYVYFHRLDGITLDMDWRMDRKEETKMKFEIERELAEKDKILHILKKHVKRIVESPEKIHEPDIHIIVMHGADEEYKIIMKWLEEEE